MRNPFQRTDPGSGSFLPEDYVARKAELRANLRASCISESMLDGTIPHYDDFLEERRKLMALKIKAWFEAL